VEEARMGGAELFLDRESAPPGGLYGSSDIHRHIKIILNTKI
jgi:hypothetical protein